MYEHNVLIEEHWEQMIFYLICNLIIYLLFLLERISIIIISKYSKWVIDYCQYLFICN